jgi:hypothetical protein
MASVSGWMGDGLSGSGCSPAQSPNPVVNFGQAFGHPHVSDLDDLMDHCTCSIYGAKTTFDLSSISVCHEVVFVYYRLYPDVDGRTYKVVFKTEKNGVWITGDEYEFIWDDAYDYWHGYEFYGWTACFNWVGGSKYSSVMGPELSDNGTDYEEIIELWDTVTNTKVAEWTQTYTITGLTHTVMTGTIQNYAGENVKGDIRIRSEYTLPSGSCSDGIGGYTGEVYYQRAADDDYTYAINVDGMEGLVRITPYKSGYELKEIEFSGITAKNLNTGNDFTGSNHLPCWAQGTITDSDGNPIENANIWGEGDGYKYGAKSNDAGKYALPLHKFGTYGYTFYYLRAIKNNFNININSTDWVYVSGYHCDYLFTLDFTLVRKSDPTGANAHVNSLCVDNQSVIILDDPVTSSTLIKPSSIGTTIVKAKTRKWGTGAAQCTTSTGTSNGGIGYGSGGSDYDGNTGDAESWE